jgi:hypothetical protein
VTSYINRLQYLAQSFSDEAVLEELPVALKGDARDWFDSLFPETKFRMNESLDEWFRQLRSRFQKNASVALQEADALRHSFDDEATLTVRQYMTRKQSLYLEAGEQQEELIIRRIHDGLDPTLATAVIVRPRMTLDAFHNAVYSAETAARAQHNHIKGMLHDRDRKPREPATPREGRAMRPDPARYDPRPRYQNGFNAFPTQNQTQHGPPLYVPRVAAQRIAEITQAQRYTATEKPAALPAPPVKTSGEGLPRRPRERYPCTYCRSKEHIDPECLLHPRNQKKAQPVTAYYADYTDYDEQQHADDMVLVDPSTYHVWLTSFNTTGGAGDDPAASSEESANLLQLEDSAASSNTGN